MLCCNEKVVINDKYPMVNPMQRCMTIGYKVILLAVLGSSVVGSHAQERNPTSLRTYTSTTYGFSYSYPMQLVPNSQDFHKRTRPSEKGYRQSVVLFSAFETPTPGKIRDGVVIMYDDVALYGADWDAKHCLRKLTMIESKHGWRVLRQETPAVFDGQSFLRTDYEQTRPPVFQSAVCTIWRGEALQFILSAGSEQEIDELFRSLNTIRFQHALPKTVAR